MDVEVVEIIGGLSLLAGGRRREEGVLNLVITF